MDKYIDRGIIKWLPFDGLVGYHQMIKELHYRLGKSQKPLLSDDKLETMDRIIQMAIHYKKQIGLTYFNDGYFFKVSGFIHQIDILKRVLVLDDYLKYKLDMITDIDLLEDI